MEKSSKMCETSDDPKCFSKWREENRIKYQKTWDRLVIASNVCKFLYDEDKACEFDTSLWNEKIDGRRILEQERFERDVKNYITDKVSPQKN